MVVVAVVADALAPHAISDQAFVAQALRVRQAVVVRVIDMVPIVVVTVVGRRVVGGAMAIIGTVTGVRI